MQKAILAGHELNKGAKGHNRLDFARVNSPHFWLGCNTTNTGDGFVHTGFVGRVNLNNALFAFFLNADG